MRVEKPSGKIETGGTNTCDINQNTVKHIGIS